VIFRSDRMPVFMPRRTQMILIFIYIVVVIVLSGVKTVNNPRTPHDETFAQKGNL